MEQDQIKKLHNGLIKCPLSEVKNYMPEILPIIEQCELPHENYYVDAKVHMLMPDQFPCIPNWHYDCVPRDHNNRLEFKRCNTNEKMFLWVSGYPLTEFKEKG